MKFVKSQTKASISTMPFIGFTRDSIRRLKKFSASYAQRIEKGRSLFLLSAATQIMKYLNANAPRVDGYDYVRDLRIGLLDDADGEEAVVIYLEKDKREFKPEESSTSVMFVIPYSNSPDYMRVLADYNPWPAELIPIKIKSSDGKVVIRKGTAREVATLKRELLKHKSKIETRLAVAGIPGVDIRAGDRSSGTEVHDDIAYAILRLEFGFGGRQKAHWRPAIKNMLDNRESLYRQYEQYVLTGKESVFDLPGNMSDVNIGILKKGKYFQDKLAGIAK